MPKKKVVKKAVKKTPRVAAKEKPVKKKKIDFDDEPEEDMEDDDFEAEDAHEVDEVGVEPTFDKEDNF